VTNKVLNKLHILWLVVKKEYEKRVLMNGLKNSKYNLLVLLARPNEEILFFKATKSTRGQFLDITGS
jgi:hypothetical protein